MPLPTFKTLEEIPEAFRGEYEEQDGEFRPKDAAAQVAADLATERTKRTAAENLAAKAAKELEKLRNEKRAAAVGVSAEELEKIRADAKGEAAEEYKARLAEAEEAKREVRVLRLDNAVKAMAAKAGILADHLGDFWKLYGEEFDLSEDRKPLVKGRLGVEVEKHVAELVKKQPGWLQGTRATGGGAGGMMGAGGGAGGVPFDAIKANPAEALAAARAAGK